MCKRISLVGAMVVALAAGPAWSDAMAAGTPPCVATGPAATGDDRGADAGPASCSGRPPTLAGRRADPLSEPSPIALLAAGVLGLVMVWRRSRRDKP